MSVLKHTLLLIPAFVLLSACGGGDCAPDGSQPQADPNAPNNCGNTRAAYSINITYPNTNAIEQLASSPGVYSRRGSVVVTDQNGNPVPDGTIVQLDVIDSIIATGTIDAGDTITAGTLTDAAPTTGDTINAVTFNPGSNNSATVLRNNATRPIRAGDTVILTNADSQDQIRYVAANPTTANSITVDRPYANAYPNATFATVANPTRYRIGQALIGTSILGIDADGNKTAGYTSTVNGIGDFRLEYPANFNTMNYGVSLADPRYPGLSVATDGSTQVWVTAEISGTSVAVIDDTILGGIAPATLAASPAAIGGSASINLSLKDKELIPLPFVPISASTSDPTVATVANCTTLASTGACSSNITVIGVSGDKATITYDAGGGATATVAVAVP